MNYKLINATDKDIKYLKNAKLSNICKYAHNLKDEEIEKINDYVDKNILMEVKDYKIISINNDIGGSLLIVNKDDGILLDDIYIEDKYRNKGIGSSIIKNLLSKNKLIYLWVYKENIKAISLYKKLNFKIIEETKTRYFMKYENIIIDM